MNTETFDVVQTLVLGLIAIIGYFIRERMTSLEKRVGTLEEEYKCSSIGHVRIEEKLSHITEVVNKLDNRMDMWESDILHDIATIRKSGDCPPLLAQLKKRR